MKTLLIILWAAAWPLAAEVPDEDARWKAVEGTKYTYSMPSFPTLKDWETRKAHLRKQILSAAGMLPLPEHRAPHAEIFGKLERDGYSIEKVYIETLPGYYLCGNLYRPRGKSGKFPGVLTPHGHWKNGRLEHQELASIPGRSINLARQGYVVFAYDMVGYNDTKQTPHAFGNEREQLWGFGPLGLQLWNSIRAADFLASLPDVDAKRLLATGASGGGTQTFLLAAVDDRIRFDVPVNMVSGIMQGGSPCENAPGLRHDAFNVEIAAMMAPRPMLLVSATGDWTKNVPKVEFPAIRKIYELYDAASQVEVVQFDSPHNYHQGSREAMYTFFGKHVLGRSETVKEQPFTVEKAEDMLVWAGRALPANAVKQEGVFAAWREAMTPKRPTKELMRYTLSVEDPAKVESKQFGEVTVLSRPGRNDRVSGIFAAGKGRPLLVVHPDGAAAGLKAVPASGRPTLYINAWMTGPSVGTRPTGSAHFYTFHRTDAQNRVQDILTALAWLAANHKDSVELRAMGAASVWALFADAASERRIQLNAPLEGFRGGEEEFIQSFFVPGIERAGGLKAALALAK